MNDNKHLYQPEGAFEFENGLRFSLEQAKEAKAILKNSPDDLSARGNLLGYYSGMNMGRGRHTNPDIFARHLKWFVEHHPRHQSLSTACNCNSYNLKSPKFEIVEQAWFEQVRKNPDDMTILNHAISFFEKRDPVKAIEYCHLAERLNDRDANLALDLSSLYSSVGGKMKEATDYIIKAYTLWSRSGDEDSVLDDLYDMSITICAFSDGLNDSTNVKRLASLLLSREELESHRFSIEILERRQDAYKRSHRLGLAFSARAELNEGKLDSAKSLFDDYLDEDRSEGSDPFNDYENIILSFSTSPLFVQYVKDLNRKSSAELKAARRFNSEHAAINLNKRKAVLKFWLSNVGKRHI